MTPAGRGRRMVTFDLRGICETEPGDLGLKDPD